MKNVKMYEEKLVLPTYGIGEPDKNPMFYENRVYQGSSGKVYPIPVIDKILDNKEDQVHNVVWLENEYIKVMLMPDLGGRIQRAYDKTNDYDFVYYNNVIKPALVGLAGPWISGGIEFNWPQHHRPSTYSPVDYKLERHEDGSCTCWMNEIDKMYGTKALTGFTLRPGKAYIEITGQLYNPTDMPQTFLWWANPAVAVNDYTKSIFPPDVHAVFDHGKRDVSEFPIAKGEYYKIDYSPGTDISRYKNIPVPTSYMAYHSDYNFVGGYDFSKEAGILHVANHHISPGKKQWTWGCGEFGQAWDRHLTDEDGPYIELMTGMYTDNQPDFTWLEPGEEKAFKQYFMPYKKAGEVKNASTDIVVSTEYNDTCDVVVYTSQKFENVTVILEHKNKIVFQESLKEIDPTTTYTNSIELGEYLPHEVRLTVIDSEGVELISYQESAPEELVIPNKAVASKKPEEINSCEELFLEGTHLEQYRHATRRPDPYYLEGLKRDPGDIRLNNAYGLLLYRRGLYKESEKYFKKAKERLTWKNPNPYTGEALFNLGLSLKMQGKLDEAYDNIYKSVWNDAMQGKGYYQLATIQTMKRNYEEALRLVEKSLEKGVRNIKARGLKTMLLRKLGRFDEALSFVKETIEIDLLDYASNYELYLLTQKEETKAEFLRIMRNEDNSYLELAIQYGESGLYEEGVDVLLLNFDNLSSPLISYYLGYFAYKLGDVTKAVEFYQNADKTDPTLCFPNKLFTIKVLENAIEVTKDLSKAYYYLGNLYYDKLIHDKAMRLWEKSHELKSDYPTVKRNLALAYYNKEQDGEKARKFLEEAYRLDTSDSRVFYELDQLYKYMNFDLEFRKEFIESNLEVMVDRDNFYIEYVQVLNGLGYFDKALDLLSKRQFHVWEGGEGRVVEQYTHALKGKAFEYIKESKFEEALECLERAKVYPHNLGEGKLVNAQENDINYYIALCLEKLNRDNYNEFYELATVGTSEPTAAMFYNDAKPDSIFYQGLASLRLGREEEAKSRFENMYRYGVENLDAKPEVDYFAISLPTFLIYNEDLEKSNRVHCNYLMALACLGTGEVGKAREFLAKGKKEDVSHLGIQSIHNVIGIEHE